MYTRRSLAVRLLSSTSVLLLAFVAAVALAQEPKESVAGADNYRRIDTTLATGGATTAEAFAELKRLGFRYVVNLRTSTEGVDLEAEGETVRKAGMAYVSLPFAPAQPDDTAVQKFLDLAKDQANLPVYLHCASGHRAGAFVVIKRVQVDGWTLDKALAEWDALGIKNQRLRDYAAAYVRAHAAR
jgi:uncharacterized protein (TIGR01244 family)